MKKTLFIALLALGICSCNSEFIRPKGKILTEIRTIGDFDKVAVSSGIELEIMQGEKTLKVETYENIFEYVETFVNDGELNIKLENRVHIKGNSKIKVYVSAETLNAITAAGGSEVKIKQGLKGEEILMEGSGGAEFEGQLECNNLKVNFSGGSGSELAVKCTNVSGKVSGGGEVEMHGNAENLTINLSGGSKLKAYDFIIDTFSCDLSGGSYARITANEVITGEISGGSSIYYKGNPGSISVNSSGGSSVNQTK